MKILIIGMGMIGRTILDNLIGEGHTITIVDENKEKIDGLIERYDVMGVVGNGACLDVQLEAGANTADTVIAVTQSDEVNILACLVAKKAGADVFISGDFKYNVLRLAKDINYPIISLGHYTSELPFIKLITNILQNKNIYNVHGATSCMNPLN